MLYLLLNFLVTIVFLGLLPVGLIFGLAGRWDLWNVWAYAGIGVALLLCQVLVIYRISPSLLKERMQPPTPERVRLTAHVAFLLLSIVQWIIVGLDQRFHWSDTVPPAGVVTGLALYAIGWALTTWATYVNPFFSPAVRIQAERGQRVITAGPYAIVRHPGYATIALCSLVTALALNSLLAIIPAVAYAAISASVTGVEDRMLRDELAGYADYSEKVRYRLVPGLW